MLSAGRLGPIVAFILNGLVTDVAEKQFTLDASQHIVRISFDVDLGAAGALHTELKVNPLDAAPIFLNDLRRDFCGQQSALIIVVVWVLLVMFLALRWLPAAPTEVVEALRALHVGAAASDLYDWHPAFWVRATFCEVLYV